MDTQQIIEYLTQNYWVITISSRIETVKVFRQGFGLPVGSGYKDYEERIMYHVTCRHSIDEHKVLNVSCTDLTKTIQECYRRIKCRK